MKYQLTRKCIGLSMALLLILALPVRVLADDWFLDQGSITVEANGSGQTVSQSGGESKQDTSPVIKQNNPSTSTGNTITINSSGGATAQVTIENVNIRADGSSGIDVQGSSKANITVEGTNTVTSTTSNTFGTTNHAAVHVGEGDLKLTGGAGDSLTAQVIGPNARNPAAIGSNNNEAMSGTITIAGDGLHVSASANGYGAGIGSGNKGEMSGKITVQDHATVDNASSTDGAGIGSGNSAVLSGHITVENANIANAGSARGSSIGSGSKGLYGQFADGATIAIKGDSNVNVGSGGTIGAKDSADANGTVTVESGVTLNNQQYQAGDTLPEFVKGGSTEVVEPTPPAPPTPTPAPPAPVPPEPTPPEPTPPIRTLYWSTGEDGSGVTAQDSRDGETLTVTSDLETASFVATRWGLSQLQSQGVKTIVFVTTGATSSFDVAEVLENLPSGNLVLTHKGASATLTLGGVEKNELLK